MRRAPFGAAFQFVITIGVVNAGVVWAAAGGSTSRQGSYVGDFGNTEHAGSLHGTESIGCSPIVDSFDLPPAPRTWWNISLDVCTGESATHFMGAADGYGFTYLLDHSFGLPATESSASGAFDLTIHDRAGLFMRTLWSTSPPSSATWTTRILRNGAELESFTHASGGPTDTNIVTLDPGLYRFEYEASGQGEDVWFRHILRGVAPCSPVRSIETDLSGASAIGSSGPHGYSLGEQCDLGVLPSQPGNRQPGGQPADITYVLEECAVGSATDVMTNVPVAIEIVAESLSGGHSHHDDNRPVGVVEAIGASVDNCWPFVGPDGLTVICEGTTGSNGRGFTLRHSWPEVSGRLRVRFYGTDPGGPFYNDTAPVFSYCVQVPALVELPSNPSLYLRYGGAGPDNEPGSGRTDITEHPRNHYGIEELITALERIATWYKSEYGDVLHINDMSLQLGGKFDIHANSGGTTDVWEKDHYDHDLGTAADLRMGSLGVPPERRRLLLQEVQREPTEPIGVYRHCSKEGDEGNHWHLEFGRSYDDKNAVCDPLQPAAPALPGRRGNDLTVSVASTVTLDSLSGLYRYEYTITNDPSSTNVIDTFGLWPVDSPDSLLGPNVWTGVYGYEGRAEAFVWDVTDVGPPPGGWVDDGGIYVGPGSPKPGEQTSGFVIVSSVEPDSVEYYIRGWRNVPTSADSLDAQTLFEAGVTGRVIGPRFGGPVVSVFMQDEGNSLGGASLQFPNPLQTFPATVRFEIPGPASVAVEVFDVRGRRVRTLAERSMRPGVHSVAWNGRDEHDRTVPGGVYFYVLRVDGNVQETAKVVVLR